MDPHHPSPFTYAPTSPALLLQSQFDLLAANDATPSRRRRRTRKPPRGRRTGLDSRRWRRLAIAPRRSPSVTRGEQSSSRRRGRQRYGRGRAPQLGLLSTRQPSQSRDIPGMVARASSSLCESCEGPARVLWDALPLQVVRVRHRPCCPTRLPTTCSDPLYGLASASIAASPSRTWQIPRSSMPRINAWAPSHRVGPFTSSRRLRRVRDRGPGPLQGARHRSRSRSRISISEEAGVITHTAITLPYRTCKPATEVRAPRTQPSPLLRNARRPRPALHPAATFHRLEARQTSFARASPSPRKTSR